MTSSSHLIMPNPARPSFCGMVSSACRPRRRCRQRPARGLRSSAGTSGMFSSNPAMIWEIESCAVREMVAARAFSSRGCRRGRCRPQGVLWPRRRGCHRSRSRRQEHRQRLGRWQILLRWEHRPVRQGRISSRLNRQPRRCLGRIFGASAGAALPPGRRQAAAEWEHPALRSPGQWGSPPVWRCGLAGVLDAVSGRQPGYRVSRRDSRLGGLGALAAGSFVLRFAVLPGLGVLLTAAAAVFSLPWFLPLF